MDGKFEIVSNRIDDLIKKDGVAIDQISKQVNINQMKLYRFFIEMHIAVFNEMTKIYSEKSLVPDDEIQHVGYGDEQIGRTK